MNKDIIIRLSKYKRLLSKLKALGMDRVYSNNLGDAIGVTPALVRKDFSMLNLTGNKKGGYEIDSLLGQIKEILKGSELQKCVIVGCGRLGSALMDYKEFENEEIEIVAGFDIDSSKWREEDIPILPIEQMADFIKKENIIVGIITVPDNSAAEVLKMMIDAGVRGILNFSSIELKCANLSQKAECCGCTIHNVNLMLEIEHLFYQARTVDPDGCKKCKEQH